MSIKTIEEKSAGTIIFREEVPGIKYLLLHYPSGHWDFVKGKIEENENLKQTVIREAREETGIEDLEFVDNFKETIGYNFQFEGKLIRKSVVFFLAKTNTRDIVLSHEHHDYTWLDYDEALEKTTYDNAKIVLTKANALLSKNI